MRRWTPGLVALALILAGVYGLETYIATLEATAAETFDMRPVFWATIAVNFLFAGMMLAMFWVVTRSKAANRFLASIALLIGIVLVLSVPARQVVVFPDVFRTPAFTTLSRGLPLAGAFMTLAGLFGLVKPGEKALASAEN